MSAPACVTGELDRDLSLKQLFDIVELPPISDDFALKGCNQAVDATVRRIMP
jgi:hypothetical protein